jgi:hypothetical protein
VSDTDRAEGVLHTLTEYIDDVDLNPEDVQALVEEFAAVRLAERKAIVDALVAQYGASCRVTGGVFSGTAFVRAIESIERGEHAS